MVFLLKVFAVFVVVGTIFSLGLVAGVTMKQPTPHCPSHSSMQHSSQHHRHHRS